MHATVSGSDFTRQAGNAYTKSEENYFYGSAAAPSSYDGTDLGTTAKGNFLCCCTQEAQTNKDTTLSSAIIRYQVSQGVHGLP